MAIKAYNCRSTSLLLVRGGNISSIGAGVLRPFSARFGHNVLRIRKSVDRSEAGSLNGGRAPERVFGNPIFRGTSCGFVTVCAVSVEGFAEADWEEMFEVETAFARGWSRDIRELGLHRWSERFKLLATFVRFNDNRGAHGRYQVRDSDAGRLSE
jgi:hypothetical protein